MTRTGTISIETIGPRHERFSIASAANAPGHHGGCVARQRFRGRTRCYISSRCRRRSDLGWLSKGGAAEFFADKPVDVVLTSGGTGSMYSDWMRRDATLGINRWRLSSPRNCRRSSNPICAPTAAAPSPGSRWCAGRDDAGPTSSGPLSRGGRDERMLFHRGRTRSRGHNHHRRVARRQCRKPVGPTELPGMGCARQRPRRAESARHRHLPVGQYRDAGRRRSGRRRQVARCRRRVAHGGRWRGLGGGCAGLRDARDRSRSAARRRS